MCEETTTIVMLLQLHLCTNIHSCCFVQDSEKRLSRMCSIFTIAMHVGISLKSAAKKVTPKYQSACCILTTVWRESNATQVYDACENVTLALFGCLLVLRVSHQD